MLRRPETGMLGFFGELDVPAEQDGLVAYAEAVLSDVEVLLALQGHLN